MRAIGQIALDLINDDLDILHAEMTSRPLSVCINLSPTQLDERDLLDRLVGWEPAGGFEQLVIEVTEAAAVACGGRAVETLTLLRKLGARLSIDDFGTGVSTSHSWTGCGPASSRWTAASWRRLSANPAATRSSPRSNWPTALGAEVVVEGVEDEQLWELTRSLGVEYAQGFHVAKPMPLPDSLVGGPRRPRTFFGVANAR